MAQSKVRYAVVGLGYIAQAAVLPSFAHARRNSSLHAIVSGSTEKLNEVGDKYRIPVRATYDDYERCLQEVDAVYLCTPNSEHSDYAARAAQAGKHILCEKPLAVTQKECDRMIRAAKENNVKIMTAYRLHFEPLFLEVLEIVEMTSGIMRFDGDRLATFTTSFNANGVSDFRVVGTEGNIHAEPAYEYAEALGYTLTIGENIRKKKGRRRDQFAAEIAYFSECVMQGKDPEPSAEEGCWDVGVVSALYQSAETNKPVKLHNFG